MSGLHYVERDWIIQRCTNASAGNDAWEDFLVDQPTTRTDMEADVERLQTLNPAHDFRGHNIAYCASRCHPTAFKRGRA